MIFQEEFTQWQPLPWSQLCLGSLPHHKILFSVSYISKLFELGLILPVYIYNKILL